MTNREKFEEVFNYHPDMSFCPIYCTYKDTECKNFTKEREQNDTCESGEWRELCESGEWWELEYQEPKQSNKSFPWCTDCKEYDQEKHCCHRYSKVIRETVEEIKQEHILNEIKEVLKGWNSFNSYDSMCQIYDIVAESERET